MVSPPVVPTSPISGLDLSGFGMPGYTGPGSSGGSGGGDFADVLGSLWQQLLFSANAQQSQTKLESDLQAKRDAVQNAFAQQTAQQTQALQLAQSQGQINSAQAISMREQQQREAEFARDYALRQIEFEHTKQMDEAQLAANPRDFVASQYYLRGLGTPQGTPAGSAGGMAYDNNSLQNLVQSFATGQGQQPLYNPANGGQGAFGVAVPPPNAVSRATYTGMDDTSKGILDSFIRAGVNNGNGQNVALDPAAWQKQNQQSWVPTLNEGTSSAYTFPKITYS